MSGDLDGVECGDDGAGEGEVGDEVVLAVLALHSAPRGIESGGADVDEVVAGALVEADAEVAGAIGGGLLGEAVGSAGDGDRRGGEGVRGVVDDSAADYIGGGVLGG